MYSSAQALRPGAPIGTEGVDVVAWSGGSLKRPDAAAFVGPKFERYWRRWARMSASGSSVSWNWPAALLNLAWLGSRKLHAPAAILLSAAAVVLLLAGLSGNPQSMLPFLLILYIAAGTVLGLIGNGLYRRRAVLAVQKAQNAASAEEARLVFLRGFGGRSIPAGIVWTIGAVFALSIAFSIGMGFARHGDAEVAVPPSPNDLYFTADRFYNPAVMRMLFEKDMASLRSFPEPAEGPIILYVIYAADQVEANCGQFLSFGSTAARGVLRAATTFIVIGSAIAALTEESDRQAAAVGQWFSGIQGIETIETQAKRDATVFMADKPSCVDMRVYQLQDGLDLFFRS